MAKRKWTAAEVTAALVRRHGSKDGRGEWVCIEEAFSGFSPGGGIDVLALGVWKTAKAAGLPHAGRFGAFGTDWDATNPVVAYEIKVSRADMRRELYGYTPGPNAKSWKTKPVPAWPNKAYFALLRSHYFMFAVPRGLLKDEEIERREKPADEKGLWIPPEVGLVEVDEGGCHVSVEAPLRDSPPSLERYMVAELVRHVAAPNSERRANAALARSRNDLKRLLRKRGEMKDRIEALERRLEAQPVREVAAA